MFMQRLISTLILIPLVLLILFYSPAWLLGGMGLIILTCLAKEYWQLIPIPSAPMQALFLLGLFAAVVWFSALWFPYWLIGGLLIWLLIMLAILTYPYSQRYWGYSMVVAGLGFLVISLFAQSIIHLYFLPQGKAQLSYLLFLVWASDIGAYITGKQWGKHSLIPKVSPGKSWEGIAGALIFAFLISVIAYLYFTPIHTIMWFVLAFGTVVISVFGDLFISILKRRCQLKDTGGLIPGHGGILDRLDSLIAAAPAFYFGVTWMVSTVGQ